MALLLGFSGPLSGDAGEAGDTPAISDAEPFSGADSAGDQRYPLERYAALWQRSLFHAAVAPTVADPAFARDYSLAGVFEMDGSTTAALVHRRDGSVVSVSDEAAGSGGMRLIAVEAAGDPNTTRVQVEKNGQRAWIAVTPAAGTTPAVAAPQAPPATTSEPLSWDHFDPPVAVPAPKANPVAVPEAAREGEALPLPPSPLDAIAADEIDSATVAPPVEKN